MNIPVTKGSTDDKHTIYAAYPLVPLITVTNVAIAYIPHVNINPWTNITNAIPHALILNSQLHVHIYCKFAVPPPPVLHLIDLRIDIYLL